MRSKQNSGQVDHQESETDSIGDSQWGNVHEIFETEVLLGIAEVELNLETQGVVVG